MHLNRLILAWFEKVRFFKKYIFTLHFAVQITIKHEKEPLTVLCIMCISHMKNANICILENKKRAYLFVKTGKSRLFQVTLLLPHISLIARQVICRYFDFLKSISTLCCKWKQTKQIWVCFIFGGGIFPWTSSKIVKWYVDEVTWYNLGLTKKYHNDYT